MNKAAITGLVGELTIIAFVAGFFVDRQLHSNNEKREDTPEVARLRADLTAAQQEANDFASESRLKLWVDHDAAAAIQRLGYDHVFIIRWQNGIIDGWIEFDEAEGPKRSTLDFSRPTIDQWAKEGKKAVAKGSTGLVLLALRRIGKTDEFDCELQSSWMLQQEKVGGIGSGSGGAVKGKHKVKLEPDPNNVNIILFGPILSMPFEIKEDRYFNKKAVPWLNVKLIDPAK